MAPQRMISARDAQRLLDSIRGLSFVDPRYHSAIFNVLDQLALWDPAQHHHGVADAWIRRLYQELGTLSPPNPLYAKALRRLRTLCGRTESLPDIFDFRQFVELGAHASTPAAVNSDVYHARAGHLHLAVKRIRTDQHQRPDIRRSFRKEAVVWLLFNHPNIVPFYGVRRTKPSDPVDLVSKWMAHGELTSFLARHPEQNPLRFIRDVVSGLEFIHSLGMVHGDLKGRNVLVDEHHRACIADFGHTSTMQRTGLATSNIASRDGPGTIAFTAPELLSDSDAEPTALSDIYALGILIWEIFAGRDPYRGMKDYAIALQVINRRLRPKREDAPKLHHKNYDALWAITERAWAQSPAERCALHDISRMLSRYGA